MKYFEQLDDVITADFKFDSFQESLDFVIQCGELFQQHNHHPDISIFDYSNVNIMSTTHDTDNTVTEKDIQLVEDIEDMFDKQKVDTGA